MLCLVLATLLLTVMCGCQGVSRERGDIKVILTSQSTQQLSSFAYDYEALLTSGKTTRRVKGRLDSNGELPLVNGLNAGQWHLAIELTSAKGGSFHGEASCRVTAGSISDVSVEVIERKPASSGPPPKKGSVCINYDISDTGFDGHIEVYGWTLYRGGRYYSGENLYRTNVSAGVMKASNLEPGNYGLLVQFRRPDGLMYYTPGVVDVVVESASTLWLTCNPPMNYDVGYDADPPEPNNIDVKYDHNGDMVLVTWQPGVTLDTDVAGYYVYYQRDRSDPLSYIGPLSPLTRTAVIPRETLTAGTWSFWVRCMDRRGNASSWPGTNYVTIP